MQIGARKEPNIGQGLRQMNILNLEEALECMTVMLSVHIPARTPAQIPPHAPPWAPASANSIGAKISRRVQPTPMYAICAASVRAVCQKPEKGRCTGACVRIWSLVRKGNQGRNHSRLNYALPAVAELCQTAQQVQGTWRHMSWHVIIPITNELMKDNKGL